MSKYDRKNYNSCLFNHGYEDKWDGNWFLLACGFTFCIEILLYYTIGYIFNYKYCEEFYKLQFVTVSTHLILLVYCGFSLSYRMFHVVFGPLTALNILLRILAIGECLHCVAGEDPTSNILVLVTLVSNVIVTTYVASLFVAMAILLCCGCEKKLEEYEEMLRAEHDFILNAEFCQVLREEHQLKNAESIICEKIII